MKYFIKGGIHVRKCNEMEALKDFRNNKALILFDKYENELSVSELLKLDQYIYDLANPTWKHIYVDNNLTDYEISNTGLVRNQRTGKIRKGSVDNNGYIRVSLSINSRNHTKKVHRLVAQAFIPNPENKPQVNHINGKKYCNWAGNLEWNTAKENVQHSYETGLITNHARGERVGTSKYKETQIHTVCKLLEDPNKSYEEIAKETGVSYHVISKIHSKKLWADISKEYDIPERARISRKYSRDYLENICRMLSNNIKPVEIHTSTKIPWSTLSNIRNRKRYKYISNNYTF